MKSFKDREEVKKDIRQCAAMGMIITFCSIGFAALGVISDIVNVTLGLETMSWFQLAIWAGLTAIIPNMLSVSAKHLYGIESERKKE